MSRFVVIPKALLAALFGVMMALLATWVGSEAHAEDLVPASVLDVQAVSAKIQACTVRPYKLSLRGRRVYGPARSICDDLTVEGPFARQGKMWEIRVIPAATGRNNWDLVGWGTAGRKIFEITGVPGNGNPLDIAIRALDIQGVATVEDTDATVPQGSDTPAA
jgi:hypothetical protein